MRMMFPKAELSLGTFASHRVHVVGLKEMHPTFHVERAHIW